MGAGQEMTEKQLEAELAEATRQLDAAEAEQEEKKMEITIDKEAIDGIGQGLPTLPLAELKDRFDPDAQVVLTVEADEEVTAITYCDQAWAGLLDILGDMVLKLTKPEFAILRALLEGYRKWDPTPHPVAFRGTGSDQEVYGARPQPYTLRIAAKAMHRDNVYDRFRAQVESIFQKVPATKALLPAGFMDC